MGAVVDVAHALDDGVVLVADAHDAGPTLHRGLHVAVDQIVVFLVLGQAPLAQPAALIGQVPGLRMARVSRADLAKLAAHGTGGTADLPTHRVCVVHGHDGNYRHAHTEDACR